MTWAGPPLPVEIVPREPPADGQPVPDLDGTTGNPIALPPGAYLARVTLPPWTGLDRLALTVKVEIRANHDLLESLDDEIAGRLASLDLKIDLPSAGTSVFVRPVQAAADAPPRRSVDVGITLPSNISLTARVGQYAIRRMVAAAAGLITSPTSALVASFLPVLWAPRSGGDEASVSARAELDPVLVGLSEPRRYEGAHGLLATAWDGRSSLAVVPVDHSGVTVASFCKSLPEGSKAAPPRLELAFGDRALNTLWLFMQSGGVRESRRLASSVPFGSEWLDAEMELFGRSPLTATLDAYVLLRANWREDLLAFSGQALARDGQLADMRVIHAEVLGRMGQHAAAAAVLADLGTGAQPWPLFRPGAAYALARASLYSEAEEEEEPLPLADAVKLRLPRLVDALGRICAAMDPGQIPLVLTGTGPPGKVWELLSAVGS